MTKIYQNALFTLVLFCSFSAFSQLPDGSTAPDFTQTDINGNSHNLYEWLDQGYTVVIKNFATWCGPCWNYHSSGALDEAWAAHGPAGWEGVNENTTDDLMILSVEVDDVNTNIDDLLGTGNSTLGNWVEGTNYPLVDDASDIYNLYECTGTPTIFMVCPNQICNVIGLPSAEEIYEMATETNCGNPCPEEIYMGEGDGCGCFVFEVGSFADGESVNWDFGDGMTIMEGGHFVEHCYESNGEFTITADYSSNDCEGALYTLGMAEVDCIEECELDVTLIESECGSYLWEASNYPENANIFWEVDEMIIENDVDLFDWSFATEGLHTICAFYETPECPEGVFWCESIEVDLCGSGCPEEYGMDETGDCACYVFEIGSFVEGESVFWNFGDGTLEEEGGHFTQHCFEENGVYQVYAIYSSPNCNGESYVFETIVVDCYDEECELDVFLAEEECGSFLWEASNYPENANLIWEVDEVIIEDGVNVFDWAFATAGTHTLCVYYETPECPNGVFWCETIIVDLCNDDCPDAYGMDNSGDCGCYVFEIGSFVEGESVFWNFGDGGIIEEGGHFVEHCFEENGVYQVYAIYSSPNCNGVSYVFDTIVVDCFDEDCELDVTLLENECGSYLWEALNYPENANLIWEIDEVIIEDGVNVFDWAFATAGTHTLCVYYETPECPNGVFWCETIIVDLCNDDCPDAYGMDNTGDCGCYVFEIGSFVEGESVFWNFGDGSLEEEGGHFTQHCFEENGVYQVYAIYSSPNCNGESYVFETIVVDCFDEECDLDVTLVENECGFYFWQASNYPENANLFWEIDEQIVDQDESALDWVFTVEGVHSLCVFYETPECPNGVFWCTQFEVELCDDDCPDDIFMAQDGDCGCYVFEIGSFVEGESVTWDFGDGTSIIDGGHFAQHCYEANGEFVITAQYSSSECEGAYYTLGVATVDCFGDCTEVGLGFDSFLEFGGPNEITWLIENEDGVIDGGTCQYSLNVPYCDAALCLEDGCYTVSIWPDIPMNLEGFEFYANAEGSPLTLIGDPYIGNAVVQYTFSLNGDCSEVDCTLEIDSDWQGGNSYLFEAFASDESATIWWDFGDGTDGEGDLIDHEFPGPGTYEVCAFYETPDCPLGVEECIFITITGDDCTPVTISFSANIDQNDIELMEWILESDGISFEGDFPLTELNTDFTITFCVPDGCYSLELTPMDGLLNFLDIEISVVVDGDLVLDESMLQGDDTLLLEFGVNEDCTDGISILETNSTVAIYPVPSNENVTISNNGTLEHLEVKIFSLTGQLLLQRQMTGQSELISLDHFADGFYHVLITGDNTNVVKRIEVMK